MPRCSLISCFSFVQGPQRDAGDEPLIALLDLVLRARQRVYGVPAVNSRCFVRTSRPGAFAQFKLGQSDEADVCDQRAEYYADYAEQPGENDPPCPTDRTWSRYENMLNGMPSLEPSLRKMAQTQRREARRLRREAADH